MKTSEAPTPGTASAAIVTVPNLISLARLAAVPVFVWLFVGGHEEWGVIVYAVGAASDFVDGYVARRTGAVSELGKLLDPLADRVFIVALAVALVARSALPTWLAVFVVARDVLLLSLWPLLERRGVQRIEVNIVGKAATALLLVGLTWLALGETGFALGRPGERIGIPLVTAGAALYWAAAAAYGRTAAARLRAASRVGSGP